MHETKFMMLLCVAGTLLASGCMSPLYKAAQRADTDAARELIDGGANVNQRNIAGMTALMAASGMGSVDLVSLLLDKGARVDATGDLGVTALGVAAMNGHTDVARLLITRRADMNKAIAGLHRAAKGAPFGFMGGTYDDAIDLLAQLKRELPPPAPEQGSTIGAPPALPAALPVPKESATPF